MKYLPILLTSALLVSCKSKPVSSELESDLIKLASSASPKIDFATEGVAVKIIREHHSVSKGKLVYTIIEGDHPTLGDGTCDYHCLVGDFAGADPFIGIRIRFDEEQWHIAGYWTP